MYCTDVVEWYPGVVFAFVQCMGIYVDVNAFITTSTLPPFSIVSALPNTGIVYLATVAQVYSMVSMGSGQG